MLVPKLLAAGYRVRVLDWYLYGRDVLAGAPNRERLEEIVGDIRDAALLRDALEDCHAVIHLACISNDPSFELDPALSRSVNYDAFEPLVRLAKEAGVRRFVYASTSSVYGVSDQPNVTEDHPLVPLTDYNRYKGLCEPILLRERTDRFAPVVIRPATVCGYSPRQRLDLTVNILTTHAVHRGVITVFGGSQMRPNIHIQDITALYLKLLELPVERVAGEVFNAGYQNLTVERIAHLVRDTLMSEGLIDRPVAIEFQSSDDLRSYHICSDRIRERIGFVPRRTIEDAVRDLARAFAAGLIPEAMTDDRYHNIRTMKSMQPANAAA